MRLFKSLFGRTSGSSKQAGVTRVPAAPKSEGEFIEAAAALVNAGREEEALHTLRSGFKRHSHSVLIAQQIHDTEQLLQRKSLQQLLAEHGSAPGGELCVKISELYRKLGDTRSALQYGREAIQLEPDNHNGYRAVGVIYFEQFRSMQAAIAGMNALRCLLKAHTLAPQNSQYLIHLAEVFVILRAPRTAWKFLQPVHRTFQSDPQVIALDARIKALPEESTTQIQDLFALLEQQRAGAEPARATTTEDPAERAEHSFEGVATLLPEGEDLLIVDGNRKIIWERVAQAYDKSLLEPQLGLVAETARLATKKMGLGKFNHLQVACADAHVCVGYIKKDLTGILVSKRRKNYEDAEALQERIRKRIVRESTG